MEGDQKTKVVRIVEQEAEVLRKQEAGRSVALEAEDLRRHEAGRRRHKYLVYEDFGEAEECYWTVAEEEAGEKAFALQETTYLPR